MKEEIHFEDLCHGQTFNSLSNYRVNWLAPLGNA